MNHENNIALLELSRVWLIDGDWMRCRACMAVLIASRDGEPLRHKPDCKHAAHAHPWSDLRKAMEVGVTPKVPPVQTGAAGSVPDTEAIRTTPTFGADTDEDVTDHGEVNAEEKRMSDEDRCRVAQDAIRGALLRLEWDTMRSIRSIEIDIRPVSPCAVKIELNN